MKVMKERTGKDKAALKNAQDELAKITEEAIDGGRAIQAELDMLREKPPLVDRLQAEGYPAGIFMKEAGGTDLFLSNRCF